MLYVLAERLLFLYHPSQLLFLMPRVSQDNGKDICLHIHNTLTHWGQSFPAQESTVMPVALTAG